MRKDVNRSQFVALSRALARIHIKVLINASFEAWLDLYITTENIRVYNIFQLLHFQNFKQSFEFKINSDLATISKYIYIFF